MALSPFVENGICRGAFYMRPRKFILPQAGTGGEGHVFPCCVCRGDHWSPVSLPPQRIFRDSFLVRQAGTGEQCSPLQEFSPVWARNIPARRTVLSPTACGRSPLAEGAKRGRRPAWYFLPLVENVIRRGAFYMRPRRFILPQAGTGGYGIRLYVFEAAEHQPSRDVTAGGGL